MKIYKNSNLKAKKKYGQNFLNGQKQVLDEIMSSANVLDTDYVLEIGPGHGALTELLLAKCKHVIAVEIDDDLIPELSHRFSSKDNFTLIHGDFIELDFDEIMKSTDGQKLKVVANIPYYITSPIIQKLIEHRAHMEAIYIMVQKEVAERICATSGKERSVLTLSIEFFAHPNYLFTIGRELFMPMPNVDSAFMSIIPYDEPRYEKMVDEENFFRFVKLAFASKRKNIVNNLAKTGIAKNKIIEILDSLNISPNERAENITIEKYIELIKAFEPHIHN